MDSDSVIRLRRSKMNAALCYRITFAIAVLLLLIPAPATANPVLREIRVMVLGQDGKPVAAGREVTLVGLSRNAVGSGEDEEQRRWEFRTDVRGQVLMRLGEFNGWEDKQGLPGWGRYAVVVENSETDAGAVSPSYFMDQTQTVKDVNAYREPDATWGHVRDLPREGVSLTLRICKGITLRGRAWNAASPGRPLAGVEVVASHDLGHESHTGRGGEILVQKAVTDKAGYFAIHHIHPRTFYVGLGDVYGYGADGGNCSIDTPAWLESRSTIGGVWTEGPRDILTPHPRTRGLWLEIRAATKSRFVYSGTVKDTEGKPVVGAKVTLGTSAHIIPETFADDHSFSYAETDSQGRYSVTTATPWARGYTVEAPGFITDAGESEDGDGFVHCRALRPGRYDVVLERAPK